MSNSFADNEDIGYTPGKVNRMHNGRPYVLADPLWSPHAAKALGFKQRENEPRGLSKPFTRTTTFVSCFEDTYNLGLWQIRQAILGIAQRDSLIHAVNGVDLDSDSARVELDELGRQALEAADSHGKATKGTAFHSLTHQYDRTGGNVSLRLNHVTGPMMAAYVRATEGFEYAGIECGMVNDELEYFGTPDRLRVIGHRNGLPFLRVVDIKTGSLEYAMLKFALQFRAYALSKRYDPDTGHREAVQIDLKMAELVHVPMGGTEARVYPVDISAVAEAFELIPHIRNYRKLGLNLLGPDMHYGRSYVPSELDQTSAGGQAAAWSANPPESL